MEPDFDEATDLDDEPPEHNLREEEFEKFKNILAFICTVVADTGGNCFDQAAFVEDRSPDYIKEKFLRYIKYPNHMAYQWGMHPLLRERFFDKYCERWGIPNPQLEDLPAF